ncbi:MAG: RagB/SusD family nutrient uptake outer membrane protein [Bacteroidaceae bacterium]|nr:RagB/SusD family nutrient uptake outer membrane protein [Bacteroidaceae bacterium]
MKNIFKYFIGIAVAAATLSSCEKMLAPSSPSAFEPKDVYSSYDLAQNAIYGIYQTFALDLSYRNRVICWYGFNTDIEWYNTHDGGEKASIATYDIALSNSELGKDGGPFSQMYTGVERCNLAVEGLEKYGNLNENANLKYLWAEALTLRALLYYDLTKIWGDVPARFEPSNSDNLYMEKTCRDTIYVRILNDLDKAIEALPYPGKSSPTQRTDRINKVFAEGLYARIALAASGYALRPEDGEVGTGGLGTVRKTGEPKLQASVLYPKALAHLQDAINNGGCSLEPDYATYWKRQNSISNIPFDGETLFVLPFAEGRGRWNTTFAVRADASSILGATARGGAVGPVPTFWWKYDEHDVRRDVTCVNWKYTSGADETDGKKTAGIGTWYFGKYRLEDTPGYNSSNTDDGVKPAVMRFSDILLMAAEIANELGETALAREYFMPVRLRAFPDYETEAEAYVNALDSKEKMQSAIENERAFEFCGEFLRKADLIRWNKLKKNMDKAKDEMTELQTLTGSFAYLKRTVGDEEINGDIWWRPSADGVEIYGLKPGESAAPSGDDWQHSKEYVFKITDNSGKATGLHPDIVSSIYVNDPDKNMYWPIFSTLITGSRGYLKNDYDYAD